MQVESVFEWTRKGMEDNIWNFTNDGKCSNCGNCCSNFLPMSQKEVEAIRKYIHKNDIKESRHIIPEAKKSYDATCPFRDNTRKVCTIYPVRPKICQVFICDSEKRAKRNRDLLKQTRGIVQVRETFFGGGAGT